MSRTGVEFRSGDCGSCKTAERSRSTIGGGGGDVTNLTPFWRVRHEKIPPGVIFDQPPGEKS